MMTGDIKYHSHEDLPEVRGKLRIGVDLARYSWFRTGGPADVLFEPKDEADLIHFLKLIHPSIPITVIGVGSNVLVSDQGVEGVVIRLGKQFAKTQINGCHLTAGAGAMDVHVARIAAEAGIAGLSWLVGVPGTIGGAIKMNAGAYDGEMKDCLVSAKGVTYQGSVFTVSNQDLDFSYRHSNAQDDWIFLEAILVGTLGDSETLNQEMQDISQTREESQPIGSQTGGSTFKNPKGYKAWELIDGAGCRGLRVGGAMISEKHCNFLINIGAATATDISTLGETVRRRVLEHSGIELEWEIKRIGRGFD